MTRLPSGICDIPLFHNTSYGNYRSYMIYGREVTLSTVDRDLSDVW